MAARVSRVSLLLFGVAALTTSFVLVQAAPFKETAKIDEVNLNTRDLNVDDGNSLETRDLWDTLGLSGVVSSPNGFKDFANNVGDEDQDFRDMVFDSGSGGTEGSFNNEGNGTQDFSGAVFNTGGTGPNGGTKRSFNNRGSGTQLFGRGAKFNLGPTTDSFNNSGPGKQTGLETATFKTGPVRNSFNGRNAPPGNSGEPTKRVERPKKPQPAPFSLFSWLGW